MESINPMDYVVTTQASTEKFRSQIQRAVEKMTAEDLSHVEIEGVLVADDVVAKQFLEDSRYRHIGNEKTTDGNVHVFLFVHAN